MNKKITLFWFRRDLRFTDNVGLYHALTSGYPVMPIFIFDTEILEGLPANDARVSFIYKKVQELRKELQEKYQSSLAIFYGNPQVIFTQLITDYSVKSVYTNTDYEPYAQQRDQAIKKLLVRQQITFNAYKDQVIFEKDEVVKSDKSPYLVYTPYMKRWKSIFNRKKLQTYHCRPLFKNLLQTTRLPTLTLETIGFEESSIEVPAYSLSTKTLNNYKDSRDFPSEKGTSSLSVHLRFGTIGIREIVQQVIDVQAETFLNELIWREFFMQILYHYPKTITEPFNPKYSRISWRNNTQEFELWKAGKTGYPMVDAGMRELNQTGLMHNRVRMVVASFLCKHLLIDWRWGEAYFAEKLLDYEMASNVGNWQWAAGCGVDAAPYFRIFNPTTQFEKFDKLEHYVTRWISEYNTSNYPEKMVDHKEARERCLKTYKKVLS